MSKMLSQKLTTVVLLWLAMGQAKAEQQTGPHYPIKVFDVVRIKATIQNGDYYLASFPEKYKYGPDRLTGPCKGNMDQMHVVVLTANNKLENNARWRILPAHGVSDSSQGNIALPDGSRIRLQNLETNRNLHAQACPSINSPLDMQVSTCEPDGGGDVNADWNIELVGNSTSVEVGFDFRLRHGTTAWTLRAQGNKPPLARDWLEVSAFVPGADSTERIKYSSWSFEKDVSESNADIESLPCYSRNPATVKKNINSLLNVFASNYEEAYSSFTKNKSVLNIILKKAGLDKIIFDQEKWNDKLKDNSIDFFKDIGIAAIVFRLTKSNPELQAAFIGASVALIMKEAIETSQASILDSEKVLTIERFLIAEHRRTIRSIEYLRAKAEQNDIIAAQAQCISLERNKSTIEGEMKLLNAKVDLLKKMNR